MKCACTGSLSTAFFDSHHLDDLPRPVFTKKEGTSLKHMLTKLVSKVFQTSYIPQKSLT